MSLKSRRRAWAAQCLHWQWHRRRCFWQCSSQNEKNRANDASNDVNRPPLDELGQHSVCAGSSGCFPSGLPCVTACAVLLSLLLLPLLLSLPPSPPPPPPPSTAQSVTVPLPVTQKHEAVEVEAARQAAARGWRRWWRASTWSTPTMPSIWSSEWWHDKSGSCRLIYYSAQQCFRCFTSQNNFRNGQEIIWVQIEGKWNDSQITFQYQSHQLDPFWRPWPHLIGV